MPLLSEAQLCNVALLRIGERQLIDDLDEDTAPAKACKALYAHARDEVLEAAWWNWATRRAVLALLDGETRTGWGYVYALPDDCLAARSIYTGTRSPSARQRIPFSMEMGATGRVLLTDMEDAELVYTARVTTVALFPTSFADAVAWRLAVDLVLAIPVKPQLAPMIERKALSAFNAALSADRTEMQEDRPPESEFITVRG